MPRIVSDNPYAYYARTVESEEGKGSQFVFDLPLASEEGVQDVRTRGRATSRLEGS